MKKFVSFISAFVICAIMTFPIVSTAEEEEKAEENNITQTEEEEDSVLTVILDGQTNTYSSNVKCVNVVHSSYQVTIPDKEVNLSKPVEFKVSATDVVIAPEQTLDIFVESANNWKLIMENEEENNGESEENKEEQVYIEYELKSTSLIKEKVADNEEETEKVEPEEFEIEDKTPLTEGKNNILSIQSKEAVDNKITKVLTSEVTGKAKIAGTYSDTLTFTIEINDKPVDKESTSNDEPETK